ncbi:MAG: TraR/DksA family transcriptional regulator [Bryobacteraceae bacterium]
MSMIHQHADRIGCKSIAGGTEPFAELLRKEKARLRADLREGLQNLQTGRVAQDDEGPLLYEQFVSILQNDLAYGKLKAIETALRRLENGEYAVCQECGDCISEKRLRAVPWAAYCLDCQDSVPGHRTPPFRARLAA